MSLRTPHAFVLSITLGGVAACEARPELRYETAHLRVGTDFDEPLCQGNLDHMELVITTIEDELGVTMAGRVDVYLWAVEDWPPRTTGCVDGAAGCFGGGELLATPASVDHELVHAVLHELDGATPFWSEGTAEALQSTRTLFPYTAPVDNLDLDNPGLSYRTAGHFVRWLFETRGGDRLRTLLNTKGDPQAVFEQIYGLPVETAQTQFFAEAPYSYGARVACDHPALTLTGNLEWGEELEIDCGGDHVYGGPGGMWMARALTIPARGHYQISTSAPSLSIARCDDEDLAWQPLDGDPSLGDIPPVTAAFVNQYRRRLEMKDGPAVLDLAPGRYEIALGFPDYEPRSVNFDVRPAPGPIAQLPTVP